MQKAQDENTIAVVDGLNQAIKDIQPQLPPGARLELITDGSRPIRVAVENVRRTLIEERAADGTDRLFCSSIPGAPPSSPG